MIESVSTSGGVNPTHLPYTTTEGETQPSPSVLPNVEEPQPQEIETRYTETTTETTVTTTITETPAEIAPPEIPEHIQNTMYESADGTVFARQEDPHIEIAVDNGYYAESKFSDALKYYPGKKYWVSMQVFSHMTLTDISAYLQENGIDIRYIRDYDGRLIGLITEDDLSTLQQIENMGFLIDLAPEAEAEH